MAWAVSQEKCRFYDLISANTLPSPLPCPRIAPHRIDAPCTADRHVLQQAAAASRGAVYSTQWSGRGIKAAADLQLQVWMKGWSTAGRGKGEQGGQAADLQLLVGWVGRGLYGSRGGGGGRSWSISLKVQLDIGPGWVYLREVILIFGHQGN